MFQGNLGNLISLLLEKRIKNYHHCAGFFPLDLRRPDRSAIGGGGLRAGGGVGVAKLLLSDATRAAVAVDSFN